MYTKKLLSAAVAVAVMTSGAMAFDFRTDGTIVDDITKTRIGQNGQIINNSTNASYIGGQDANTSLKISTNSKGDALIYPAFKTGNWDSELVVRNSQDYAVVAKVVLYASDNSRELMDFDIYLSPYDVFRFKINADRTVTTEDGSFALVDPTLATDDHKFITEKTTIGKLADGVDGGYAIIYGMTQARDKGDYHGNHTKLFKDFRSLVSLCRDNDNNGTNTPSWRDVLGSNSPDISNGTAIRTRVVAPSVPVGCAIAKLGNDKDYNATVNSMDSNFTSVGSDALFGDVRISTTNGDSRDLLIKATALDNYSADNQMLLWVPGEYAAIQDRRMTDTDGDGLSEYNIAGLRNDSTTFITKPVYYTFDKNEKNGANSVIVTQPTKRALVMANDLDGYWNIGVTGKNASNNTWGEFNVRSAYRDENENLDTAATSLQVVISPVSGDPDAAYKNELQVFSNPERTETSANSLFRDSKTNGFAIMNLGVRNRGLPAIVTQMTGSIVGGKAQTNWIYSTTDKD